MNDASAPSEAAADIAENDAFALIAEVADMARDLVEQLDDALALPAELSFYDNDEAWTTGREADCPVGALAPAALLHEQREREIDAQANGARQ